MNRALMISAALVFAAAPALAQDGQVTLADQLPIDTIWEMYSGDAYVGSRAGCAEALGQISSDLALEPALATSWTQTDPLTWEFQIREGVKFQDGAPLDAEAVALALNHLLAAPVPARGFSPDAIESVKATGPMVVTIKTKAPLVTLPGSLASPNTAIMSPAAYSESGVNPIGTCTGPFEITEIVPQQSVTLKRFDGYWGGPAKLAGGQIRFIPDANTRATMVRTGEAQISRLVPASLAAQFASSSDLNLSEVSGPRVMELLLNNSRPPFDNPKVREAIKYAIDTAGISTAVYEGFSPAANDPFRSGEPWEAPNAPDVVPDLDKARALLAEAGVDPASLTLEILAYTDKTELRDVAQIIQAMLGEIGITVNVRVAEYASIEPDMLSGNYDMALLSRGYLTDLPEPIAFLKADYTCEGSYNISHYCDPEFDTKLQAASAVADPQLRFQAYAELAQNLYDQSVTVYLVNETTFDVSSAGVTGFTPHPLPYYIFDTDLDVK